MITPQMFKALGRSKEIVTVLIRHGFGQLLDRVGLPGASVLKTMVKRESRTPAATMPVRLRLVLQDLGPTFVKLGQLLSTRPDLVPKEYTAEFAKLQEQADAIPYEAVRRVVQAELGALPEDIFASFARAPFAAASIGQVHKAVTRNGEDVAVKVQRPNIHSQVRADLEILALIAELLERHIPEMQYYRPTEIVAEFRHALRREMDYTIERRNLETFRANFASHADLVVPRAFAELSTPRVLTMEYLPGCRVDALTDSPVETRRRLAAAGLSIVLKQVFEDGFFHADPHPGNIKVLPEGKLVLLDFGMVGRVPETLKFRMADLLLALAARDHDAIAEIALAIGDAQSEVDHDRFLRDITEVVDYNCAEQLKNMRIGEALADIMTVALTHHLRLPATLSMMIKALVTVEQTARTLDPDIDLIGAAKPYVKELVRQRYGLQRNARSLLQALKEYVRFMRQLPTELTLIIRKLKSGTLTVEFKHLGLDGLIHAIEHSTNRISFSLIIAALIVGSSIVMSSGRGGRLFGFPTLGLIGYLIAAFLGLWLLIMIIRSGKV